MKAKLESGQGSMGKFLRDSSQYDQAVSGIRGMQQSILGLRDAPFVKSDEMWNSWNATVTGGSRKNVRISSR